MPASNPRNHTNLFGIRKRDLGFSYFDLVSDGPVFTALCMLPVENIMHLESNIRLSYTDYDEKGQTDTGSFEIFDMFYWTLTLGPIQNMLHGLLKKSDIQYLPNPNTGYKGPGWTQWSVPIAWYRFRRALHAILVLPLSIWGTTLKLISSPFDSIRTAYRALTQTKGQREEQKIIRARKILEDYQIKDDEEIELIKRLPTEQRIGLCKDSYYFTRSMHRLRSEILFQVLIGKLSDQQTMDLCQHKCDGNFYPRYNFDLKNATPLCIAISQDAESFFKNLISPLTLSQRETLLKTTPVLTSVALSQGIGLKYAKIFLDDMDIKQRINICIPANGAQDEPNLVNAVKHKATKIINLMLEGFTPERIIQALTTPSREGDTALSAAMIFHDNPGIAKIFFEALSDDEISNYLNQQTLYIKKYFPNQTPTAYQLLATQGAFDAGRGKQYAINQGLDIKNLLKSSFELNIPNGIQHGFTRAFLNPHAVEYFNVNERRDYLLNGNKPLARALDEYYQLGSPMRVLQENTARLDAWLEGFTPEEKLQALTPATPRPSSFIVLARDMGLADLVVWLQGNGLVLPAEPARRPDNMNGEQSVHTPSVHMTVTESLISIIDDRSETVVLSGRQINEAIAQLRKYAQDLADKHAPYLSDEAVVQRALLRITDASHLKIKEALSEMRLDEILARFWIGYNKMPAPDDVPCAINDIEGQARNKQAAMQRDKKATALCAFHASLFTIQRDYNDGAPGADHTICGGGTITQATIALSAVDPEHVWVEIMDENRCVLNGLNALTVLLNEAYKNTSDKNDFIQKCRNKKATDLVPDFLWETEGFVEKLKNILTGFLKNDRFDPPRWGVNKPEEFVDGVVRKLKANSFVRKTEMSQALTHIQKALEEITGKENNPLKKFEAIDDYESHEKVSTRARYFLDGGQKQVVNEYHDAHPPVEETCLRQYQLHKIAAPLNRKQEAAYEALAVRHRYAAKSVPDSLPESFKAMLTDKTFMSRMYSALDQRFKIDQKRQDAGFIKAGEFTREIPMLNLFAGGDLGQAWLNNIADVKKTLMLLDAKHVDDITAVIETHANGAGVKTVEMLEEELDQFLKAASPQIYGALLCMDTLAEESYRKGAGLGF